MDNLTIEKQFTTGDLIQLNQEASAIHTIALLMEKVDITTYHGSIKDQEIIEDQISHMLLAYESIGLNSFRIGEEAHKLYKAYTKSKELPLTLIK